MKIFTMILCALVLAFAFIARREHVEKEALKTRLESGDPVALTKQIAVLRHQTTKLKHELDIEKSHHHSSAANKAQPITSLLKAAGAESRAQPADRGDPPRDSQKQQQIRNQSRVTQLYSDFFANIDLPKEKHAALRGLLEQRHQAVSDALDTAKSKGVIGTALLPFVREAIRRVDQQIQDALTPEEHAALRTYRDDFGASNTIKMIETELTMSGVKLTGEQRAILISILRPNDAQKAMIEAGTMQPQFQIRLSEPSLAAMSSAGLPEAILRSARAAKAVQDLGVPAPRVSAK